MHFRLRGIAIPSDSKLDIHTIGEKDSALHCVTSYEDCCKNIRRGEIYYIRNDAAFTLPKRGDNEALYRNRGPSVLRLNRRINTGADISDLVGVYRCCLPDGCGDEKCIEITLV